MEHFIVGGDETCILASSAVDFMVIGSKDRKKHEKIVADSRASIAACCTFVGELLRTLVRA